MRDNLKKKKFQLNVCICSLKLNFESCVCVCTFEEFGKDNLASLSKELEEQFESVWVLLYIIYIYIYICSKSQL